MEQMPWFKWWDGTAADIKLRMIAEESGTSVAVVLGIWVYLLEKASVNEDRGYIGGIERGLMNYTLKLDNETVETVCNGFKKAGVVTSDDYVTEWNKRQAKRENQEPSGSSTERVRALRERRKAAAEAALKESNGGNEQSNAETGETTSNDTKRPKRKKKEEEEEVEGDTKTKEAPPPTGDDALFPGVASQVVADFKALRKQKRAPITPTAIAKIVKEAALAGITLESALTLCCSRGWQGFEASWLERRTVQRPAGATGQPSRHSGFDDIDYSEGVEDGRIT